MKNWKFVVALFILASVCQARVGIEVGGGYGRIHGDKLMEKFFNEGLLSPLFGFTYHADLTTMGAQFSVQINRQGAEGTYDLGAGAENIHFRMSSWFMDLPALFALKPIPELALLFGPVASIYLSGSIDEELKSRGLVEEGVSFAEYLEPGSKSFDRDAVYPVSLGVAAGIRYMVPTKNYGIQCTYKHGLTPILKDLMPKLRYKTDIAELAAVYMF